MPKYVVRPGRGPVLREVPGHDGSYFEVVNTETGKRAGRYVDEARALKYAQRRNQGELEPSQSE